MFQTLSRGLLALLFLIAAPWPAAATPVELTPEEQSWLATRPVVRIGNPSLPPYHFAMLKPFGLAATFTELPLADLLAGLKEGSQDVIMDPIYKPERESLLFYSERSFDITLGIFGRYDRKDISDLASLKGKRIGSYRGYALEAKLAKLLPDSPIVHADDSEGMLRLVSRGEADFCVVELRAGEYILQKQQISNVATFGVFQAPGETPARAHDYAVRKTAPELASLLAKSYRAMDPGEKQRIWKRWFSSEPESTPLLLTPAEREWLAAGHTVRARVADYAPYMTLQPAPSGLIVDYLSAVSRRAGFKIEFLPSRLGWTEAIADVAGPRQHYDLLPVMNRTPEREQQFAMTRDIMESPLVIYIRSDRPFVSGLDALRGKTIAVEKSFVVLEKLRAGYPDIRLLLVDRPVQALEAVATGRADAYIGNLTNASFVIKQHHLENLMVAAPSPFGSHTQAVALRKDWQPLAGIIEKGLAAMPAAEKAAIDHKWGSVEVGYQTDYTLVWQVALAAAVLLLWFLYWHRRMARELAQRQLLEHDLRQAK